MSKTLEIRGLRKVYDGHGRSVEALADLTFSVEARELVCVVGPSGCGKTTLLRCVAGLLEPTAGEVLLQGDPVTGPPPDLAVVFQEYGRSLFPWMTVRANVELPLRSKRLPRDRRDQLVRGALAAVDLGDVHGAYPGPLGGGGAWPGPPWGAPAAPPRARWGGGCSSGCPSPPPSPTSRKCYSWTSRS